MKIVYKIIGTPDSKWIKIVPSTNAHFWDDYDELVDRISTLEYDLRKKGYFCELDTHHLLNTPTVLWVELPKAGHQTLIALSTPQGFVVQDYDQVGCICIKETTD